VVGECRKASSFQDQTHHVVRESFLSVGKEGLARRVHGVIEPTLAETRDRDP
jgi:hypothetical protein